MCQILSEVRCLEGPFQPLFDVEIRQYRANAMPPSLPVWIWLLRLSVNGLVLGQMHLLFPSCCPPPFISSWQGLGVGTVPLLLSSLWLVARVSALYACMLVHDPIHMPPLRPLGRSHQEHISQAAGTVPICSIYAPRVSLPVPSPTIPRMLTLLISAHDHHHHLCSSSNREAVAPTGSYWLNAAVSFLQWHRLQTWGTLSP